MFLASLAVIFAKQNNNNEKKLILGSSCVNKKELEHVGSIVPESPLPVRYTTIFIVSALFGNVTYSLDVLIYVYTVYSTFNWFYSGVPTHYL